MNISKINICTLFALSGFALSACLPVKKDIQTASKSGDFALLDCQALATAEGSLRQRLASPALGQDDYAATDSRGNQVPEKRELLENAAQSLLNKRSERNCISSAPIVTADSSLAAGTGLEAQSGRYLQMATFQNTARRNSTIAQLEAMGLKVSSVDGVFAGSEYSRVLVGPLTDGSDINRARDAARSLGFNDAFFVDG